MDDERDTLPPSPGEDDLDRCSAEMGGVSDTTNRKLLTEVIVGIEELRRDSARSYNLLLEQSSKLNDTIGRVDALENARFWGSRVPMTTSAVSLIVSLIAIGTSLSQLWLLISIIGK